MANCTYSYRLADLKNHENVPKILNIYCYRVNVFNSNLCLLGRFPGTTYFQVGGRRPITYNLLGIFCFFRKLSPETKFVIYSIHFMPFPRDSNPRHFTQCCRNVDFLLHQIFRIGDFFGHCHLNLSASLFCTAVPRNSSMTHS